MDTRKLWSSRAGSFWGDVLPYLRYVLSSGLAVVFAILFIVSTHFYAQFLNHFPENFPANWVIAVFLLPVVAISPIRTFFKPADIIYLLPAEAQMKSYIDKCINVSMIVQSVFVAVIWFVVWPMYRITTGADGTVFLIILFIILALKWFNLYGRWKELQLQERALRQIYIFIRWCITAASLYVLFTFTIWKAAIFIALVLSTYAISLRLPAKYYIRWEYLIELEKLQRARYYRFLSWFVEVPEFQSRVHLRLFFSRITKFIPFEQTNTYRYLYLKTWIRSDLFGITLRLIIVGIVIIYMLPQDMLKTLIFIFFVYLMGIQLTALGQHHRYVLWIHVYPLSHESRIQSILYITTWIYFIAVQLLYFSVMFTFSSVLYAFVTYLLGIAIMYIHYLKLRNNLRRNNDD